MTSPYYNPPSGQSTSPKYSQSPGLGHISHSPNSPSYTNSISPSYSPGGALNKSPASHSYYNSQNSPQYGQHNYR